MSHRQAAPVLEEAGSNAVWKIGQVDEREEVDGFEFAVDSRGAANAARNFKIRAEQTRRTIGFGLSGVARAIHPGLRHGAQRRHDEIFSFEGFIHGQAVVFVLRGNGTAAD